MNSTQQQNLRFLSVKGHATLDEIIRNVPSLLIISHLRMRQKHMWTKENGGETLMSQIANLTYDYLFRLCMEVIEEIRGLTKENYELIVDYVNFKTDLLRMNFQIPKCLPTFFRKMFEQCAITYAKQLTISLMPPNGCNQPMKIQQIPNSNQPMASNTISYNQCGGQQNIQHQSISAGANQMPDAPSGASLQNSQICPTNNTYVVAAPQTNMYRTPQPAPPHCEMNGNNELLTFQATQVQPHQLQAVSVVSVESTPQPQFVQQNPNHQFQMQFGVCQQTATMPCGFQNTANANQMQVAGQMQALNSYNNCANSLQNQNAIQALKTLPILWPVDVAQLLQNTVQPTAQTNNAQFSFNSNHSNFSEAYNYQNINNPNRVVVVHQNCDNSIQTQSNWNNNNRCIQVNTTSSDSLKIPLAAQQAPVLLSQPQMPTNAGNTNAAHKRSASSIQDTNTIEAAPTKKMISISSRDDLITMDINNNNNALPIGDSSAKNICEMPTVNAFENTNKTHCGSRANTLAPAISPATTNKFSAEATTKIQSSTVDNTLNEPNTSKAFDNDAIEKKSCEMKTASSPYGQCEKSKDFEILVETFTGTGINAKIEKTEKSETLREICNQVVDLCENSTDSDSDVVVVKTLDENVSKTRTKVSRLI